MYKAIANFGNSYVVCAYVTYGGKGEL
ncbi:hypothetical protein RSK20926_03054 [Roseobacter sp. SK209-2-6]|nr:hypothetical protein RSK20926_03054 [Roseobacter sp. SK209-2-6]